MFDALLIIRQTKTKTTFEHVARTPRSLAAASSIGRDLELIPAIARSGKWDPIPLSFTVSSFSARNQNVEKIRLEASLSSLFVVLMYLCVVWYAMSVATSLAEEKSSRVVEILRLSASGSAIVIGKLLGVAYVTIIQLSAFVAVAVIGVAIESFIILAKSPSLMAGMGLPMEAFASMLLNVVVFTLIAYTSYSVLFAVVAAGVSEVEKVRQYLLILYTPLYFSFYIATIANSDPDRSIVVISSMIPFVSPLVIFSRMSLSVVPVWQIAVSVTSDLLVVGALAFLASYIYSGRPKIKHSPAQIKELVT